MLPIHYNNQIIYNVIYDNDNDFYQYQYLIMKLYLLNAYCQNTRLSSDCRMLIWRKSLKYKCYNIK